MIPKITLDNFQLMGDGTTYWLENFDIEKIGGKNVLKQGYLTSKRYDDDSSQGTGFSNLEVLKAFDSFIELNGTKQMVAYSGSYMFMFPTIVTPNTKGEIHQSTVSGSSTNQVYPSNYPDIKITREGNVLYSTANHLGIGWYGKCKSSSGTTKIVDSAGRNFTTLGVLNTGSGSTAPAKYVYNLNNKERYTVTSITTTDATNDTLNFSAGTSNDANDEYIVFVDNGWTGSANFKMNTTISTDNQFKGQTNSYNFKRQIKLFGDDYFILNGNYLATLNRDMVTWAYDAKQLPDSTQATCLDVNNGNLIVGGEFKGAGKLLLWDGYTSGWISILDIDLPPQAIYTYGNGWIYTDGISFYFTNGYEIQKITSFKDSNSNYSYTNINFNSLLVSENHIITTGNSQDYNRLRCGIYKYNLNDDGWLFVPYLNKNSKNNVKDSNLTALYQNYDNNRLFTMFSTFNSICYLTKDSSGTKYSKAIFNIKLPQKMKLNKVELNLSNRLNEYSAQVGSSYSNDVYVSISRGYKNFWTYTQIGSASTTSSLVNTLGNYYPAKVGQQVLILDGNEVDGETTWITGITNPNTATETLAISPSLSADITDTTNVLIADLYSLGKRTINFDENLNYLQTLQWDIQDFFSDKLMLEVYITGTQMHPMQINSINIY